MLVAIALAGTFAILRPSLDDADTPDRDRVLASCVDSRPVWLERQDGWLNVRCSDGSTHVIWEAR